MRKLHKERLKGAIGIICILFAIGMFAAWESYGREAFTYDTVLVFNQDVEKGTIVEKSMLGLMKIDQGAIISNHIKNPEKILGQKTGTYIPRGLQLCGQWFNDPGLVTGDGSYVFSLPMEWVYSYPQTLRRGDLVYFYAIDKTLLEEGGAIGGADLGSPIISAKVAYVKDSSNREVVDVTADRMDGSAAVAGIELVISEDKYQKLKENAEGNMVFILMYE